MNRMKTMILLAVLTALFLFVGRALGGQTGLAIAIVLAGVMNFAAYWFSDKLVLRMYHAQEVSASEAPELFNIVGRLAAQAQIPMPKVYIIPEEAPNAFATGRNPEHAAVAVTLGLTRLLTREELAGVIAHELGHVKNRDTLVMTVSAALGGALGILADMALWGTIFGGRSDDEEEGSPLGGLLGIIIAPIAATMIQLAISRSREFMADEAGARLTSNPLALASALRKIEAWSHRATLHAGTPATAHLFIINPFTGGGMAQLFSTHPATTARIERLEKMAQVRLAA